MNGDFDRRAVLGGLAAIMAGGGAFAARAADLTAEQKKAIAEGIAEGLKKLSGMSWDRGKRDSLFRSGRASVEIVDFARIRMDNLDRTPPEKPISYEELAIIRETVEASLKYYHARGLDAPMLPVLDGKFVVFFVDDLGVASGMTGEAIGLDEPWFAAVRGGPYVPKGIHILYNTNDFRDYYKEHPWSRQIPIAHEIVHAIDAQMRERDGEDVGGWVGEGLTDALAQASLKSLGYDPLKALKAGARAHGKSIGLRPYDFPLALRFGPGRDLPARRPPWTRRPEQKEADTPDHVAGFWQTNATYFTQSFWRFLFHEHAGRDNKDGGGKLVDDYRLCQKFKRMQLTDDDVAKAKANVDMDAGIPLLDRFLRKHHPCYMPTGLYGAFPAFIAHFVEWPDQVIGSRQGVMAHPQWIHGLFMEGAPLLSISEHEGIDHVFNRVRPMAARALRFKLPPLFVLEEGYPRVTISVTALDGGPDAIDNIRVGVRGQCLANFQSQRTEGGSGRTRRWMMVDVRPLMHAAVNGESILTFINCAPDACKTRPLSIRVSVVLEVARANGQLFYTPKPTINAKGQEVTPPRSASPAMGKQTPTLSTGRGIEGIEIGISQDEDMSKLTQAIGHVPGSMGMFAERKTDSTAKPMSPEEAVALTQLLVAPRGLSQLGLRLSFPRVEAGHRGAVAGGTAIATWFEPRYQPFGIGGQVTMETDKVDIRIVSSTEGALIGTFKADFGQSSLDYDKEFGGVVTGNFSVGIAVDEKQDQVMPVDPSALVNTDFFHLSSMSGMTGERMIEALGVLRETTGDGDAGGPAGNAGGQDGQDNQDNPAQGDAADFRVAGAPSPDEIEACATTITRLDLDRALRHLHGDLASQSPDIARQLRETYLADWENTKRLLCLWKVTGTVP